MMRMMMMNTTKTRHFCNTVETLCRSVLLHSCDNTKHAFNLNVVSQLCGQLGEEYKLISERVCDMCG